MLLSILTLTNYDNTIWNGFNLPDGLNRKTAIKEICMQCAEMALVYPDLEIMRTAITAWSEQNRTVWRKMYYTTVIEYNPIWNVDANIIEENSGNNSGNVSGDNVNSVKGYNSNAWAEAEKNESDSSNSGEWSERRSTRRTGNIGVTSTQELLERERKVAEFNMYKFIVDSFKKRFCLMVY